jgi:hypothetical protein
LTEYSDARGVNIENIRVVVEPLHHAALIAKVLVAIEALRAGEKRNYMMQILPDEYNVFNWEAKTKLGEDDIPE